jgi:hypothetical protein
MSDTTRLPPPRLASARVVEAGIAHDRRHGSEGLGVVHPRPGRARRNGRASAAGRPPPPGPRPRRRRRRDRQTPAPPPPRSSRPGPARRRCASEISAPMRVVSRSGAPIRVFASRSDSPRSPRPTCASRHEDAADRRAFLPRLGGHLAMDLLQEQVEFRRAGTASGPRIVAFRLSCSATKRTAPLRSRGGTAQRQRRVGGAREADHVLPVEPVEQIAQIARHQLQRAFGQDAALQHDPTAASAT